jgi:hypothetical protein
MARAGAAAPDQSIVISTGGASLPGDRIR